MRVKTQGVLDLRTTLPSCFGFIQTLKGLNWINSRLYWSKRPCGCGTLLTVYRTVKIGRILALQDLGHQVQHPATLESVLINAVYLTKGLSGRRALGWLGGASVVITCHTPHHRKELLTANILFCREAEFSVAAGLLTPLFSHRLLG